MELIFALLDIILPISVILLALLKVHKVRKKWDIINLLAAYCIGSFSRNLFNIIKTLIEFKNLVYEIIFRIIFYVKTASFALIRLILFFCISEIFTIYAFKTNFLKVFYVRKFRVLIFVHLCAQISSIPVTVLQFIGIETITGYGLIIYYSMAIYTAYEHKSFKHNHMMKKSLMPLIFYFLPITLIDISIGGNFNISDTLRMILK
ncbi:unnamed protein product [Onchocerca flexuosa]|uniref:Serpentine receptor class gamma n=1 Tax=Onchocerca flexuosa TaxID=387005 RepID=A0A183HHT3_9BILA|nr:unnamed protein product [Onchocerca flexuosa]